MESRLDRRLLEEGIIAALLIYLLLIFGLVCIFGSCWYVKTVTKAQKRPIWEYSIFYSMALCREVREGGEEANERRRAEYERRRAEFVATNGQRPPWYNPSELIDQAFGLIEQDERAADTRRRAVAAALAREVGQQTNATIDNLVGGMSPSDRAEYVQNFLKTDVMTVDRLKNMKTSEEGVGVEDGAEGSFISSIREASGFRPNVGNDSSERFPHCSICLERLRVNEDIGLSQNLECPHIFHKGCIAEWLIANKDCPICRRSYLNLEAG